MLTGCSGGADRGPDRTVDLGWSDEVRSERSATGLMGRAIGMPPISGAGLAVISLNKILGVAGLVLLVGGALLGFRSVSASGTSCGSAFRPAAGITPMACDNALTGASTLTTVVMSAGALCLIAAVAVKVIRDRAQAKVNA